MKATFLCDETMVITIPIGTVKGIRGGQNMPEKFQCVYRDFYKVFAINGKPKPLGAAQAITGLFIVALAVMIKFSNRDLHIPLLLNLASLLFVVVGFLSFAAGQSPNMHVTKVSFAVNIVSFLWSSVAIGWNATFIRALAINPLMTDTRPELFIGVIILIMILLAAELFMSLYLIYWMSKAVCRQHFNMLPVILLKRVD